MRSKSRGIVGALRRFARAEKGSTLIEFGLLAAPFFILTFGVAEVAMIGLAQTSLAHAAAETSRGIRTGEVQTNMRTAQQVHDRLCDELNDLLVVNCADNLFLDVKTFDSFVNVENENPIQGGNFSADDFDFDPGVSSSIVVVRAYYRWEILTPFFENLFRNVNGGERILVATLMFRNEPF